MFLALCLHLPGRQLEVALAGTAGSAQHEGSPPQGSVPTQLQTPLAVLAELPAQLQLLGTIWLLAAGHGAWGLQNHLHQPTGSEPGLTGQRILSNYYVETPFSIVSVAWLPITNIIQQQKRFLVNFIFIYFLGGTN